MRRNLPTFTSLICFESAAKHLNFTRAAEELNLSQSAVSRQVQNLEDFLGIELFKREKKRLYLNDEGQSYATTVRNQLDQLEAETLKLITKDHDNMVLNIGTFPTFGSRWLIPKLPQFTQENPEIQVNFTTSLVPFDFLEQDVDVVIQHGDGNWPEYHCVELMNEEVIAACSPKLIEGLDQISAQTVLSQTMLHLKTRTYAWTEWLSAQGVEPAHTIHGPQFETFGYMIRAALTGLGIAIVPPMYITEELKDGRLVSPFGPAVKSERGYYLVTSQKKAEHDKVQKFSSWVLSLFESKEQI